MDNLALLWPSDSMNLWKIDSRENEVIIKWSHNYFEDYKRLAYSYYECGFSTFDEVINSGHDNIKSDMWFLTGVFLIRHSIELGLKSLLCRIHSNKNDIQKEFKECCHDVSMLFRNYCDIGQENYLTDNEKQWLVTYFASLEEVDSQSDMFRFPFDVKFFSKYRDMFLDNVCVANNLLQAFALVKKSILRGTISNDDEFDATLQPSFFVFDSDGFANCYLWQSRSDKGFHVKITGYSNVIDYIYNNPAISKETKVYPLIFMFRNLIELCLKRLFYCRVDDGVPLRVFYAKRRSHLIKTDLWKNVKTVIVRYASDSGDDIEIVDVVERSIDNISTLDKNGDVFRYPTSYSLEYRFDEKRLDLKNIYEYFKAITNFLDGCYYMLDEIADYQAEMKSYYDW